MCAGDYIECNETNPCEEWKGQCNDHVNNMDCQIGLRCGTNNCLTRQNDEMKLSNCCYHAKGT